MKKMFFGWIERMVAAHDAAERKKREEKMERVRNLPLVEARQIEVAGKQYRMITAQRRGLLIDMVRSGTGIDIPEPRWTGKVSYSFGPKTQAPERAAREALLTAGIRILSKEEIKSIADQKLLTRQTADEEEDEKFIRVANVFIFVNGDEIRHLQRHIEVLAKTVLMSEYGAGTRIFLGI